MKKIILLVGTLFLHHSNFAQVTLIDSFMHGGIMRTYRLYVPAVYNGNNPVPIVLNLHGYTSNAIQQEFYGDFRPIADTANFIIVHPDGTFDGNSNRFWNAFGASPIDDIGFLSTLLDTIIVNYSINQNRIYSTGMSNGGYMSYLLACSIGHRIAAIASVTGTMTSIMKTACTPSHPTPIMEVHGTADGVVPFFGDALNLASDSVVKYWVGVNHCNPVPIFTAVPNLVVGDGCTAEHYLFEGGDNGSTVEFYKIIGGGHTWPGAPVAVGVTNMDISASAEIWRFFSKYTLNNLATSNNDFFQNEKNRYVVFPNPSSKSFKIHFDDFYEREISIFNNLGQCVYVHKANELDLHIELENKGLYYLQVKSNTSVDSKKLLVE